MSSATDPTDIRPLTPTDHENWLALWQGYQEFYKVELGKLSTAATWARILDPIEPVWGALAWRDGAAVGLVHWLFHRSTWTVEDYCYLQDLFVDPATRGAGVGRRLIVHVYAEAGRAKSPRVYWLTHQTNRRAMVLYDQVAEKSGFVHYRKQI